MKFIWIKTLSCIVREDGVTPLYINEIFRLDQESGNIYSMDRYLGKLDKILSLMGFRLDKDALYEIIDSNHICYNYISNFFNHRGQDQDKQLSRQLLMYYKDDRYYFSVKKDGDLLFGFTGPTTKPEILFVYNDDKDTPYLTVDIRDYPVISCKCRHFINIIFGSNKSKRSNTSKFYLIDIPYKHIPFITSDLFSEMIELYDSNVSIDFYPSKERIIKLFKDHVDKMVNIADDQSSE